MGVVYRICNDFAMQFRKFDPDRFAPLACLRITIRKRRLTSCGVWPDSV